MNGKRAAALLRIARYYGEEKQVCKLIEELGEATSAASAVLMRLCETKKALIYLSVAAHQNPGSAKYARALREAQAVGEGRRFPFARHKV